MAVKQLFRVQVLLVLCQMLYEAVAQQCIPEKVETSILGTMLRRHIYKRIKGASLGDVCLRECFYDVRCQSFNYFISQYMCELNNRTKEARPEDFVPDSDRYYFGVDMNRVLLGSIPQLPAETCKEIKASEGGQAVSGKYWFDSIIPGKIVEAHCDMKQEDVDECSASISVCDVNAKCKNTRASYRCTCKAGFTGDGKTCGDIDECSASIPVCDVNANCQNKRGSYDCSCKPGFTGDGKSCADIDECSASIRVCDVKANCQNTRGSYVCSCKPGFTGDGKTCADIDECVSGVHDCHSSASCTNTAGSYTCSCNHPYTGDGKTCTHPVAACQQYQSLTSGDRKYTYGRVKSQCDISLGPGWFRFEGAAGTRMPTSCVSKYSCDTNVPGWLTGGHPTVADGEVTRKVCFTWSSSCCYFSINIKVRNCGAYYVYYFNSTPNNGQCNFRYCGTD